MKDDTRIRLSELILEELSDKIRVNEELRRKLEAFTDLPVEKVAEAIIRQFEYVLSSELRDLIVYLVEQEVAGEQRAIPVEAPEPAPPVKAEPPPPPPTPAARPEEPEPRGSVMAHFAAKEAFPTEAINIELKPEDWLYLYGFSYAPDSTGKGVPSRMLSLKGIDGVNNIILLDYGDVRFYLHRLDPDDVSIELGRKAKPPAAKLDKFKLEHERIQNVINADYAIVPMPFWTVMKGLDQVIRQIEDRYVELLRALIEVHDAVDWNVEVFANDLFIIELPTIAQETAGRPPRRELRGAAAKRRDAKAQERLMVREKNLVQEIHSDLLLHATKARIDYMIRLDNALMEDWKSILSARYTVGKEKRKTFCQVIRDLQEKYAEYQLMFHVSNPNIRFSFVA